MRYFGNDALKSIFKAVSLSALLLALVVYWYRDSTALIPRSMVFNYWWLSLMLVGGLRLLMRQYFMGAWLDPLGRQAEIGQGVSRVAIYGAGTAGNQLVAALRPVSYTHLDVYKRQSLSGLILSYFLLRYPLQEFSLPVAMSISAFLVAAVGVRYLNLGKYSTN